MKTTIAALATVLLGANLACANSDLDFNNALSPAAVAPVLPVTAVATSLRATGAESVVRDQTTAVDVALNAQSVKCSAQDYSMPMLKVLVPGLAEITVLNHRNTREGAPCIAAGRCSETLGPDNILRAGEGVVRVPVRVVLKKVASLDGDKCHVRLVETVDASIRGIPFHHERAAAVAERVAADCR